MRASATNAAKMDPSLLMRPLNTGRVYGSPALRTRRGDILHIKEATTKSRHALRQVQRDARHKSASVAHLRLDQCLLKSGARVAARSPRLSRPGSACKSADPEHRHAAAGRKAA